jgi:hypothetical protein
MWLTAGAHAAMRERRTCIKASRLPRRGRAYRALSCHARAKLTNCRDILQSQRLLSAPRSNPPRRRAKTVRANPAEERLLLARLFTGSNNWSSVSHRGGSKYGGSSVPKRFHIKRFSLHGGLTGVVRKRRRLLRVLLSKLTRRSIILNHPQRSLNDSRNVPF